MGSPTDEPARDADETQHNVVIANGFWIDVAEVSNAAYRHFVLSRPEWQKGAVSAEMADTHYLESWDGNSVPAGAEEQHVVERVADAAAQAFDLLAAIDQAAGIGLNQAGDDVEDRGLAAT